MGRTGSALDNAASESFHSTLEFELLRQHRFATRAEARRAVVGYLEEYNLDRRHLADACPNGPSSTPSTTPMASTRGETPPKCSEERHTGDETKPAHPQTRPHRAQSPSAANYVSIHGPIP